LSRQNQDHKYLTDLALARLASQAGLLGAVTANLRAVVIQLEEAKKRLHIFFYYDGGIDDRTYDLASEAITEITAYFLPEYSYEEHIERLDFPYSIPGLGVLVYERHEEKY
jgi:hypothetical protein